jgi:CDP-diacylglycerol--glycerol-3-phosphate 3-phosphatidyltransferase
MKHLPNALTVLRVMLTPLVLVGVVRGGFVWHLVAATAFIVAAASDYWDGHFARLHATASRFGQFLDPLADKILVLGTFVVLSYARPEVVPWWAVALIAVRDVGVTVLRSVVEARGQSLRTLPMAKTKTALQLTFLIAVLVFLTVEHGAGMGGVVGTLAAAASWLLTSPIVFLLLMALVAVTVGTGMLYVVQPQYNR